MNIPIRTSRSLSKSIYPVTNTNPSCGATFRIHIWAAPMKGRSRAPVAGFGFSSVIVAKTTLRWAQGMLIRTMKFQRALITAVQAEEAMIGFTCSKRVASTGGSIIAWWLESDGPSYLVAVVVMYVLLLVTFSRNIASLRVANPICAQNANLL